MKHSIINELYTCNKVLSVLENDNEVFIEIEEFNISKTQVLSFQSFKISKENLHSFIGTLLDVQAKLKGGKHNG